MLSEVFTNRFVSSSIVCRLFLQELRDKAGGILERSSRSSVATGVMSLTYTVIKPFL